MARIFASFAIADLVLLVLTALLGLLAPEGRPDRHVLMAVIALLVSCLTQVLAFTYLTVSGKVLAQAVHFGALPDASLQQTKRLKQAFARCLGLLVVSLVPVIATGASAWRGGRVEFHWLAVTITFALHGVALVRQYRLIATNEVVVGGVLQEYEQIRRATPTRRG